MSAPAVETSVPAVEARADSCVERHTFVDGRVPEQIAAALAVEGGR